MTSQKCTLAPTARDVEATDVVAEVQRLLDLLRHDPQDARAAAALSTTAGRWLAADGAAADEASPERARLAHWVGHLGRGGRILHLGARDATVAPALAAGGGEIFSVLDHPARAIAAALRHGGPAIRFGTLDELAEERGASVDLILVETRGPEPALPWDRLVGWLRAGGWLAVLGPPIVVDLSGMIEVATFCVDESSGVRPSRREAGAMQLGLHRLAAPLPSQPDRARAAALAAVTSAPVKPVVASSDADSPPAIDELLERRSDELPFERALRAHAHRLEQVPTPAQDLIDWVGGGTVQVYDAVGRTNLLQLLLYGRLQPTHRVLEPGCGCGRNARWLAPFLDPARGGGFEGFDICGKAIDWATEQITSRYPHVRFAFADVQNSNYNPGGSVPASEYRFPYADASFDLTFLPSVFTHMTDDQFRHYLREIHRVLRPGGLILSWHFLLNGRTRAAIRRGDSRLPFQPYDAVSWSRFSDNPCAAIAFDERHVLQAFEDSGLRPQHLVYGSWSGAEGAGRREYQDILVSTKEQGSE